MIDELDIELLSAIKLLDKRVAELKLDLLFYYFDIERSQFHTIFYVNVLKYRRTSYFLLSAGSVTREV